MPFLLPRYPVKASRFLGIWTNLDFLKNVYNIDLMCTEELASLHKQTNQYIHSCRE